MEKELNYFYKITNLVNNKFYYGVHKTYNIDDGYMGSGKRLRYAIKKYGIENFKKEILCHFSTYEEVLDYESKMVTSDLVENENCYNIKIGGLGGFEHISVEIKRDNLRKALIRLWQDEEYIKNHKIRSSIRMKKTNDEGKITNHNTFIDKHHSIITKEKMKLTHQINEHQKGDKNSQYGTCWIIKDNESKKIKKVDLNSWIQQGWIKGRKIK